MEKHRCQFAIICSVILFLGVAAFLTCIVAEFQRTKVKDLKLDGKLCYLPSSPAYLLGVAALICLSFAQIIGNTVTGRKLCSRDKKSGCKPRKQTIAITLLLLSWISFGFAFILLCAATSMNRRQRYGKGWLDGECYVLQDGVYIGSAILVLVTVILVVGSVFATRTRHWRSQDEPGRKVHAQLG